MKQTQVLKEKKYIYTDVKKIAKQFIQNLSGHNINTCHPVNRVSEQQIPSGC